MRGKQKMKNTNEIGTIKIKYSIDEENDISDLGEFSNEEKEFSIPHDIGNNKTFNHFNADNVENIKQAKENYDRAMKFENGELFSYGIQAQAELITKLGNYNLINTLESSGICCLDSDSDEQGFKEIEEEQLEELKDLLITLGFKETELNKIKIEVIKE